MTPEAKKPCTAATVQSAKNEVFKLQTHCTINPSERQPDFLLYYDGPPIGRIWPGDTVFLEKIETMENGNLVAVIIDGAVCLRRCIVTPNTIILDTDDKTPPQTFQISDCPTILGRALYCQAPLVAQEERA